MSFVELALDFEAFVGEALPMQPERQLRGVTLPLQARARVPRQALGML